MTTCRKIVHWRHHLRFPNEVPLSLDARDLIERLLCDVDNRLGSNGGAGEIKHHPFFQGLDWDSLYRVKGAVHAGRRGGAGHAKLRALRRGEGAASRKSLPGGGRGRIRRAEGEEGS